VLLETAEKVSRKLVFVGVQEKTGHTGNHATKQSAIWITHVEEVTSLAIEAAFVLRSLDGEGYGYPPLEAMACGIPAVISNIPVLLETTGSIALYADPHDPKSWLDYLTL